jgi:hypothetical protein
MSKVLCVVSCLAMSMSIEVFLQKGQVRCGACYYHVQGAFLGILNMILAYIFHTFKVSFSFIFAFDITVSNIEFLRVWRYCRY